MQHAGALKIVVAVTGVTGTMGAETKPPVSGRIAASDCSQIIDDAEIVVLCSEKFTTERGKDKKNTLRVICLTASQSLWRLRNIRRIHLPSILS